VAIKYATIPHRDIARGIDTKSPENQLADGYCEDLLNLITNSNGSLYKREGYQLHGGWIPCRALVAPAISSTFRPDGTPISGAVGGGGTTFTRTDGTWEVNELVGKNSYVYLHTNRDEGKYIHVLSNTDTVATFMVWQPYMERVDDPGNWARPYCYVTHTGETLDLTVQLTVEITDVTVSPNLYRCSSDGGVTWIEDAEIPNGYVGTSLVDNDGNPLNMELTFDYSAGLNILGDKWIYTLDTVSASFDRFEEERVYESTEATASMKLGTFNWIHEATMGNNWLEYVSRVTSPAAGVKLIWRDTAWSGPVPTTIIGNVIDSAVRADKQFYVEDGAGVHWMAIPKDPENQIMVPTTANGEVSYTWLDSEFYMYRAVTGTFPTDLQWVAVESSEGLATAQQINPIPEGEYENMLNAEIGHNGQALIMILDSSVPIPDSSSPVLVGGNIGDITIPVTYCDGFTEPPNYETTLARTFTATGYFSELDDIVGTDDFELTFSTEREAIAAGHAFYTALAIDDVILKVGTDDYIRIRYVGDDRASHITTSTTTLSLVNMSDNFTMARASTLTTGYDTAVDCSIVAGTSITEWWQGQRSDTDGRSAIQVEGNFVGTPGFYDNPEFCVWGINSPNDVDNVSVYTREAESQLLCALGGNLFKLES